MLEQQLEILEDCTFTHGNHGMSRNQHLEGLLNSLDVEVGLSVTIIERILAICVRDLKEDLRHAPFCLKIITTVVKQYQLDLPTSKFVASAKAVLSFTLTLASLNKTESLQTICFNALLVYPEDVLAEVALSSGDIFILFELYCDLKVQWDIRIQPIYLGHKVMNKLTSDKRKSFVKQGLAVWFSKVIPFAMNYFETHIIGTSSLQTLMELLEMLTEELVKFEYADKPQWETVLENVYSPNEYPAKMKNLLSNGSVLWHRIWIIFIKLLKSQITMNKPGVGSPINSMLPVVEMAFKMDVNNRCRAFQCWNVLIDNFSAETNELFVNKRIKLLIIPLRSNNAKIEETALAKLDTWWHLIKQYETKIDERILYPFLHFCFGTLVPEKTVIPGMLSPKMKKNCMEVFVEMVGHVECDGCVSMPRLKNKLISIKVLMDQWSDWLYSLKMAIKVSAEDDVEIGKQPVMCAWKSFVMTIAELPENNLRKDLFNDILTVIKELVQNSTINSKLADIVSNVLISSLFEESSLKALLKSEEFQNGALHILISILIDSKFAESCKKYNIDNSMKNLKMITEYLVNECPKLKKKAVDWLILYGAANDNTLQLWTALTEALQVSNSRKESLHQICKLLLWPLEKLKNFTNVAAAAMTWYSTYCVIHLTSVQTAWFHVEVDRIMFTKEYNTSAENFFILCVLLAVVKTKTSKDTIERLNKEVHLLKDVTSKYNDYSEIRIVFPILIDTLDLLSTTAADACLNREQIGDILYIAKTALNIMIGHLEDGTAEDMIIAKIIDVVDVLFKTENGNALKGLMLDELIQCRSLTVSKSVPSKLDSILQSILLDKDIDQSIREKIAAIYETSDSVEGSKKKVKSKEQDQVKFMTPDTKSAKNNSKKKEASIVNTVVENGEEFAVIKSNWKFNPRKLTENQKEKLQRKREDIPALYQDLSQSQDEFKLKSWKTDSQDASTTNSRSASTPSNDNISTIKNMSGTDIVPRIIDNFFSETPKSNVVEENNDNKEISTPKPNNIDKPKSSPSVKTPRMALKDRVFRNVRNLIEKSTVSKEGSEKIDILNQSVNVFNTPVNKCKEPKNVVNSAPSKISADRPARVKRIPKKFDDTEVYLQQKKRRNSVNQNDSQIMETDVSEQVTIFPEKSNDDANNALKVATVTIQNHEIVDSDGCKLNPSTDEFESDTNVKKVDTDEDKLMISEVSSTCVTKNVKVDSNTNPEENESCSRSDISADKSIEETQAPGQVKDITNTDNTSTPNNLPKRKESGEVKSTTKKKSRIEKELAIDMVEGHPFLKMQSDKRVTRKCLANTPNNRRRKSLADKLNKSKTDPKSASKLKKETGNKELPKDKPKKNIKDLSVTVCETQDISADATQDLSEDVIESSQDTTTTISLKSFRNWTNKQSSSAESIDKTVLETQNLIDVSTQEINTTADVIMTQENKDDTELPANKTDVQGTVIMDLTEEMDTEPTSSGDVICINEDDPVIDLNTNDCTPRPGPDTLELANADTQPTDPSQFANITNVLVETSRKEISASKDNDDQNESKKKESQLPSTADDKTITLVDISQDIDSGASSPSKDDDQRRTDFLNDTSEISPIKSLSPIEPKSPSPEASSDFMVIKLSGPLQPNGEPLEMSNSPEIFTEEKVSPDKRDQSPPRAEVTVANTSPSSSLSLKKNRPQVRSGGRAAQMLGLCVPDRLQTIMHVDRPETEEPKKSSPVNTPVRRNLRMLYQTAAAADGDSSDGKEESENFLKFKKTLPAADCSPSVPILKRKLADIADEATVSPANKRKRVSFHDPVSTSVSVQKYIESCGVRSPQSSALKRLERQLRHQPTMKSPKRLESLFKLDSILTKAVESFNENDVTSSNDTELSSIEQTPAVEVVKISELNDTDALCPDLIDCKDCIDNIASELSSPGMRLLLVKELEGKIETVGDLAKLTELEVNRICIKAPKVQVAKKVLADYAAKKEKEVLEVDKVIEPVVIEEPVMRTSSIAVQTNMITSETETQTSLVLQRFSSTQTDEASILHKSTQTNESGDKSTEDIIKSCLRDKKDFVQKLCEQLQEESKVQLAETLTMKDCTDLLVKKMTTSDAKNILNSIIKRESELHSNGQSGNKELLFLQNYLCDKFDTKDLILFCSQMLQKVYDKGV